MPTRSMLVMAIGVFAPTMFTDLFTVNPCATDVVAVTVVPLRVSEVTENDVVKSSTNAGSLADNCNIKSLARI